MGTENVKLGVCSVTYKGTDLGVTKGGVEVEVTTDTHVVTVDQFGESEVNEFIMKRSVKVKVPLAETTLDNLVSIMPGATKIGTTPARVDVTNAIGEDLLNTHAGPLLLHPTALGASEAEDFLVPLAATAGAIQFAYKHDEERIYNVEFTGYPNSSTDLLFSYGDSAAV